MFAMQAQEETSRGIEIYLAVTAALFRLGVRGQPHRGRFIEKRVQVPGLLGGEVRDRVNLDFAFFNWTLIQSFILKGFDLLGRS